MQRPSLQPARHLASHSDFVYVTTLGAGGYPETRVMFSLRKGEDAMAPVFAQLHSEFATYLATNTSSRKTVQIRQDGRACLYYSNNNQFQGLTLVGDLEEITDPAVKAALWKPSWDMYYPGGRDGGDFSVFRFRPLRGKYYHDLQVETFDAQ